MSDLTLVSRLLRAQAAEIDRLREQLNTANTQAFGYETSARRLSERVAELAHERDALLEQAIADKAEQPADSAPIGETERHE